MKRWEAAAARAAAAEASAARATADKAVAQEEQQEGAAADNEGDSDESSILGSDMDEEPLSTGRRRKRGRGRRSYRGQVRYHTAQSNSQAQHSKLTLLPL